MNGLVCPVDRHMPLAAAWARAADIDRQLQVQAAAAGIIVLTAEVRGSQHTLVFEPCTCGLQDEYVISWKSYGPSYDARMSSHVHFTAAHTLDECPW